MAREAYVIKTRPDGTVDLVPKDELAAWMAKYVPVSKSALRFSKKVERGSWVWRNGKVIPKHDAGVIRAAGLQVIKDIEPYRAIGIDNSVVGGRRQHRELLRQHGCIEVGTEKPKLRQPPPDKVDMSLVRDIKRAMGKL